MRGSAILIMMMCISACGRSDDTSSIAVSAPASATLHAVVADVTLVKMPIRIEATGQITAVFQTTLASRIQGTIQDIRVREGSVVSKEDVLVVLDSRDLRANLARAQAERQAAAAQLTYTSIKAPFSGTITEKIAEVGDMAVPGRPLLKMEDSGQLRLEAMVAESDVRAVTQGEEASVLIDAVGPRPIMGVIAQILPTGDPQTHTFLVKVTLPRMAGLKTGMFGRLLLQKGTSETIVVPRSAIVARGQLTGVFVIEPDRMARLRWVKIGRSFEDVVEVLSGLNVGERVMVDATQGIDGASVETLHSQAAQVAP